MKKILFSLSIVATIVLSSCMIEGVASRPGYEADVAIGTAPGPDYIWIGPEFVWRGGAYVKIPGRWERRPRNESVWNRGHWHYTHGQYRWERGHWD